MLPARRSPTPRALRPAVVAMATGLALLGATAACTGTTGEDVAGASSSSTAPASSAPAEGATGAAATASSGASSTTPSAPRGELGNGTAITLAFAGDSSFQGLGEAVVVNTQGLLGDIAPLTSAADFTMVNLETALGTGGTPEPKSFTFQVPAQALDALAAAGVDAVTMANNHGVDHGQEGLADSLRIKAGSDVAVLGIGADDAEAYAPLITEVKGQRLGVIAANDVFDEALRESWTAAPGHPGIASAEEAHQDRLAQVVRDTRGSVDTLVVFLHFGTEKQTCPNPRQQELARLLTDAGADIVVGTHAHRLQGMGYLGDAFVAYGLSNFVFKAASPEASETGVLAVTATGRRVDGYEWRPARIREVLPLPLSGAEAQAAVAAMDQRQACTGLSPAPVAAGGTG